MTAPSNSSGGVRLGVAGLGQAGSALIASVLRHPRVVLTAVAEPRPEPRAAAARELSISAFESIDAMCEGESVDAVYIATPTTRHAGHSLAALAAGKHVIVEKPMAVDLEEAMEMAAAAATHGRCLMVGHSQSFEPAVQAMGELARAGSLGALLMVHNWCYTDWLYRPRLPEELDSARGGGVVMRQGAHQVDILRWVAGGRVRSVRASVGRPDAARPGDGSHVIFLDFEGGAGATAVYSGGDRFRTTELTFGRGEDGRADDVSRYAAARHGHRGGAVDEQSLKEGLAYGAGGRGISGEAGFFGLTLATFERGDLRQSPEGLRVYGDADVRELPLEAGRSGRDRMLDELAEAVLDGRPAAHDGRWGIANLEVCLAALESARTRREITLRHQAPTPR